MIRRPAARRPDAAPFKGGPGPGAKADVVKDLASELGISEDKVTEALKATRPALPERGWRKDGDGPGGHGHGFGPPPARPGTTARRRRHTGGAVGDRLVRSPGLGDER